MAHPLLCEEQYRLGEGVTNAHLVEDVGVLPSQVGENYVCCAYALENVVHDDVRAEYIISALAVKTTAIFERWPHEILVNDLQILIAEWHDHKAPALALALGPRRHRLHNLLTLRRLARP